MSKKLSGILVIMLFSIYPSVFAETVSLKSGKTIEGKILEKTDKAIKIDISGIPITYYFEEIESIDGEKLALPTKETKVSSPDSLGMQSLETKKADKEVNVNLKSAEEAKAVRGLPFSTAIITYIDSGDVYSGEEIVYIDATNNKVSHDTMVTAKLGSAIKKINQRDICDGKTLYHIDLDEKTAPSFTIENGDAISNIFMESMYLKYYKEQKSFLGKECKVYSSMPGEEFYFWNGILLKQQTTNHPMGDQFNVTKEAVDIKLNVPIPIDKFEVPSGIEVMTPEETKEDMAKMIKDIGRGRK